MVWTRHRDDSAMEAANTVVQALARIGRSPGNILVLLCDPTGSGSEDLDAFVQIAEELGLNRDAVSVATPHPSRTWLNDLTQRGLGDLRFYAELESSCPDVGTRTVAEAMELLCPNLHTTKCRGVVLSVCGEHRDHLVLSSRQVAHQCTRNYNDCPYRRSTSTHAKSAP